jgi:glycosyltransferase involved in cell wall biosynthesis
LLNYNRNTFSKIYEIRWSWKALQGIPFYWHSVKKQVQRVIREVRPDIVHAHDLFPAKMISELGLPFVYDSHEYWSELSKVLAEAEDNVSKPIAGGLPRKVLRKVAGNFLKRHAIRLWTNWEKKVVSSAPIITVSDRIAEELRIIGNTQRVFVVPNFPMRSEVKDFEQPRVHTKLSSVYAGQEVQGRPRHRDIDGLNDIFVDGDIGQLTVIGTEGESLSEKVKYTGFLSRQDMYDEMSKRSIGLIPFKKHWSHKYISPNKAYEYAHAGLYVMCTSSIETVLRTLKDNCTSFEDYNDLVSKLEYFRDNLEELYKRRLKIFEFARNNLIWEKYENNIFRAYQLC